MNNYWKFSSTNAWTLKNSIYSSDSSSQLDAKYDDGQIIDGKFIKTHGIHWLVASFFIIADMAGGGIGKFNV